ncbi:anti-repressor SinI family protein [Sutcliffiella horikoshii]|nr:anti-repressor SinI family protein [Sutcliffiella horikoshii]
MMENVTIEMTENLDKEWVDLITDALEMGISSAEIREFLHNYRNHSSFKL